GRPRRCGWLDLPALKYAQRINGANGLIMTKIDVLVGLGPIKVATSYESGGMKDLSFSEALELYEQGRAVQVQYKEFDAVHAMPETIKHRHDLPASFQKMLSFIEEKLETPIVMLSFGPKRGQEISFS
ncbi:MAG TPA: adenylosuccinate synthetase, partial [Myxococcota bacterium]|nr:adenylosuccinate synthetase [Myxococcota bacterium]